MTSYLEIIKRKQIEGVNMRDIVVINRTYDKLADKLNKAKKVKNDEFYTQYSDIEKEL